MNDAINRLMFALTASAFSIITLGGLLAFGDHHVKVAALVSAFFGTLSQYMGPDPVTYKASIYTAYIAFIVCAYAVLAFAIR